MANSGHFCRVEIGQQESLLLGGGSQLSAQWVEDPAVPDVAQFAALADSINPHHVGLILDRPGFEQGRPVAPTSLWPTGDDDVGVGVFRGGPELIGKP